jgi:hypothetical protein
MHKKKSSHVIFAAQVARSASESRLTLQRNAAAAGSATALLVILQLLQVQITDHFLKNALMASSVALPLFVAVVAVYQAHIAGGKATFGHLSLDRAWVLLGIVQVIAGISLLASIVLCVWHLDPTSGAIFGAAAGVSGTIMLILHTSMIRHVADRANERAGDLPANQHLSQRA